MSYAKVKDQTIIDQLNKKSSLKVTDPTILNQLNHEPQENESHPLRSLLIGLSNLGHSTLNAPSDIARIFEQRGKEFNKSLVKFGPQNIPKDLMKSQVEQFNKLNNIPESLQNPNWRKSLSEQIPRQEEYNYEESLGQKGKPTNTDWLIQKVVEYSPEILGGAAIYKDLPIALTRRGASKELRKAQKLAQERKINNLNIPSEIMEDIPQFLPTTKPYKSLLEDAVQGGYDPVFALQSDLGEAARGFSRNPFSFAERRHGKEAGKLRNRLIDAMKSELEKQGHLDIADLLGKGQKRYRNYSLIKPYKNAAITGLALYESPYYIRKLINSIL